MESFFLSETTKYLYLLFDTENFIHNSGSKGTVFEGPRGQCVIDAGFPTIALTFLMTKYIPTNFKVDMFSILKRTPWILD